MRRRDFLAGIAASVVARQVPPALDLAPPAATSFEDFAGALLRKIAAANGLSYGAIAGEILSGGDGVSRAFATIGDATIPFARDRAGCAGLCRVEKNPTQKFRL